MFNDYLVLIMKIYLRVLTDNMHSTRTHTHIYTSYQYFLYELFLFIINCPVYTDRRILIEKQYSSIPCLVQHSIYFNRMNNIILFVCIFLSSVCLSLSSAPVYGSTADDSTEEEYLVMLKRRGNLQQEERWNKVSEVES